MKTVVARNKAELKAALKSDASEIVIEDAKLAKDVRAIRRLRKAGSVAIAAAIVAIPLIPLTGGASVPTVMAGFLGTAAVPVSMSLVGLTLAIGGTVLIAWLTDWDEVEVAGVLKLKRRSKKH